jgi:uncharacterized FlaG/YvyC family protein
LTGFVIQSNAGAIMSDAVPVSIPASLVQGIQAPSPGAVEATSGNNLPQSGISAVQTASTTNSTAVRANAQNRTATAVTLKPTATNKASVPALVQQLNKYLNDSGRANQFRVDPTSRDQTIQEINPSNGEVIGEFSVAEFPALARSLGVSGILVDSHA